MVGIKLLMKLRPGEGLAVKLNIPAVALLSREKVSERSYIIGVLESIRCRKSANPK
jgi:hypothetical protein